MNRNVSKANCAPRKLVAGMEVVVLVTKKSIFYDLLDAEQMGTWVSGVVECTGDYGTIIRIATKSAVYDDIYLCQEDGAPKTLYIVRKVATSK